MKLNRLMSVVLAGIFCATLVSCGHGLDVTPGTGGTDDGGAKKTGTTRSPAHQERNTPSDYRSPQNPTEFNGKELEFDLVLGIPNGTALKDFVGSDKEPRFYFTDSKGENGLFPYMMIKLPQGLSVPDAKANDKVRVKFVSGKTQLRSGNVAKEIKLAPAETAK